MKRIEEKKRKEIEQKRDLNRVNRDGEREREREIDLFNKMGWAAMR